MESIRRFLEYAFDKFDYLFNKYHIIDLRQYTKDHHVDQNGIYLIALVLVLIVAVIAVWILKRIRKDVVEKILVDSDQPRFRKRDKVLFYGRKMLRKVKNSLQAKAKAGKKRQLVLKFAKKMFRLKQNQPLTLQVKEPSQAFLEEEIDEKIDSRLPKEVIYMLKSIRVFGFFEQPLFLELCRQLEVLNVSKGQLFFSIGDDDDSIYIVQSGRLEVFTTEFDGSEIVLKEVAAGDSIASLLSVLDVLSGHLAPFKTISSRAKEDSVVLRLQIKNFKNLLDRYPESLVRIVQIIMVRLQRVTFTALHNYLGLTTQLVNYNKSKQGSSPTKSSSFRHQRISVIHQVQVLDALNAHEKKEFLDKNETAATNKIAKETLKEDVLKEEEDPKDESVSSTTQNAQNLTESSLPKTSTATDPTNDINLKNSPIKQFSFNLHNERLKRKKSCINEDKRANMTVDELIQAAADGFASHLQIEDRAWLMTMIQIKEFKSGEFVFKEDTHETCAVYYVLSGNLVVSQKNIDSPNTESSLFYSNPDDFIGVLEVITGEASPFTIRSRSSTKLASISKQNIYEIIGKYPHVSLKLAHQVVKRLSPFVRQIDFALDWNHVESGRAIYRQNELSDSTFIVLSGRLRSVITRVNGKKELTNEYGRGDLVGIVEVLTQTTRSTTILAVRDTELAKLPSGLLDFIKIKHPIVVTRLVHLLGHRILGSIQEKTPLAIAETASFTRPNVSNFATIAILSINDDVPIHAFCYELKNALQQIDLTLLLNSSFIRKQFGPSAFDQSNEYRLSSWLGQQEDQHKVVIYQCDNIFSAWTKRCIRQADCILIVACADQRPTVGNVEKQLENLTVRTQKELVLLHREGGDKPKNTVEWLNIRSWCSSHHHIRCPKKLFNLRTLTKVQQYMDSPEATVPNIHSDFSRLARFLTGKSIGLVLGGGGARGASHVGLMKSIRDAGIPIDMVGGVSIGAFMGGLYCLESDLEKVRLKARNWAMTITSIWNQILDLTYPATAMFTGSSFNRTIYEVFGETTQIEDLWLPYFTVTTDITASCPRIHRNGSLWRYVRSSMSLSGYLPPLCDPVDGHLLLDGGYVNNLPADVMRDVMGAQTIMAVDVGSQDEMDFTNYGDQLNGWWLLWCRWMPFFTKPIKVPNLPDIQSRLAYISCVRQLDEVKRSEYCTYIRPPIDKWKTLQFRNFDEILDVGLNHGKALFNTMTSEERNDNNLLNSFLFKNKINVFNQQGIKLPTQATFTDLAERVVKINKPCEDQTREFLSLSEYEDDDSEIEDSEIDCYNSDPELPLLSEREEFEKYSRFRERKISNMF